MLIFTAAAPHSDLNYKVGSLQLSPLCLCVWYVCGWCVCLPVCVSICVCACVCIWRVKGEQVQPLLSSILVLCNFGMLGGEVAGPCTVSTGLQYSLTPVQNDVPSELEARLPHYQPSWRCHTQGKVGLEPAALSDGQASFQYPGAGGPGHIQQGWGVEIPGEPWAPKGCRVENVGLKAGHATRGACLWEAGRSGKQWQAEL